MELGPFMNRKDHPEVFTSDLECLELNSQRVFTIDSFTEWVSEQKEANLALQRQLYYLESLLEQQDNRQSEKFQTFQNCLEELHEREFSQQQFENEVIESFVQLHAENHSIQRKLEEERQFNRTVAAQVEQVSKSTNGIAEHLEEVLVGNEAIALGLNKQFMEQENLSKQLDKQEVVQEIILDRLDRQEGLTEKILKQMDQLRSIIFERSTMLAEKIEGSYLTTSHYISKLLKGNEQPTNSFMIKQQQQKKD